MQILYFFRKSIKAILQTINALTPMLTQFTGNFTIIVIHLIQHFHAIMNAFILPLLLLLLISISISITLDTQLQKLLASPHHTIYKQMYMLLEFKTQAGDHQIQLLPIQNQLKYFKKLFLLQTGLQLVISVVQAQLITSSIII